MRSPVSQIHAVGLALAAYTCWVLADTSLKVAGHSALPAYEVLAIVGLAEVAVLLLWSALRGGLGVLWPKAPGRQLLRSFLDLGNNLCVVVAVRHLPLALFYILVFFAPIVTTLLSAVVLRERLGWRTGLAIAAGFAGVVVAVDPWHAGRSGDMAGFLACMVCVSCFSVNIVWSRVLTQTETPESLTFVSGLLMVVAGTLLSLHGGVAPEAGLAAVLSVTAVANVTGSLCFFLALRAAPAATVTQYHYSQLLTGAGLAWLIWRERLTTPMLLGAVLIIGAGAYTAAATYRLQRAERVVEDQARGAGGTAGHSATHDAKPSCVAE